MALANVELSNTFNEFRTAHNLVSSTINGIQDGTLSVDVVNAVIDTATITSVGSNLVPSANLTYDLGSPSNWWNDLYLSGNTIFIGAGQIKVESNTVKFLVNDAEVFSADSSGSIPSANSITANTVDVSDTLTVTGGVNITGNTDITGNLTVTGNLNVTGNTVTFDVESKVIEDPLIYLASNNYFSDLVDIGFIGNYYNGVNQEHTGIVRHAIDGRMYLFTGYEPEPTNNIIDVTNSTFEPASMVAGNAELDYISANGVTTTSLTSNSITINDYSLPTSDGSANQIFITDGSGNVTFSDLPSSGVTTGKAIAMAIVFGG